MSFVIDEFLAITTDCALHIRRYQVAHRAAHPERYPLREDLANAHPARQEQAKHYPPTKVHLQIYGEYYLIM